MQMWELIEAEIARRQWQNAECDLDTLAGYEVLGVMIKKGETDCLQWGAHYPILGTGTLSSPYWDKDLTRAFTDALTAALEARKKAAEDKLHELGVEF
jgi:hypothetical protein